jgi:hypothetical protein
VNGTEGLLIKKHVKIYLDYHGYGEQDVIVCEYCDEEVAVDVHHIDPRGMGGNPSKDTFENLIGLGRGCHNLAEAGKISKQQLLEKKKY